MNTEAGEVARKAGRAAGWAVAQNLAKQAIDLVVFLLLARLLTPEAFGLVASVMAIVVVLSVLVELGLGDALVQHPALQERHTRSAFHLLALTGVVLTAVLAAVAVPLARLQGQQALTPLLLALAPLVLLQALNVVPLALLQRRFAGRPLAMRSFWGTLCGAAAGVSVAVAGGGAWSLAAQQLTAATVGGVLLWRWSGFRPARGWDGAAARELLAFGRHVLATRGLNVLSSKADVLAVGAVLGPVALGLYSVAARLQLAVEQVFTQGVDHVALSAFSRTAADPRQVGELHRLATQRAAAVGMPFFTVALLGVPDALALAIGPAWASTGPVLQLLLAAAGLHTLTHFNHAVFKACGRPDWSARLAVASTVLTAAGLLLAVRHGIAAVALAYLLRAATLAPLGLVMAGRLTGTPARQHLRAWAPAAARAALIAGLTLAAWAWAAAQAGPASSDPAAAALRVAVLAVVVVLVQAPACWAWRAERLRRSAVGMVLR